MARSRNNSRLEGSFIEFPSNERLSAHRATGILSQTLSPSPTVRWILSANIRNKSRNDVVFVGETFVQLREYLDNGILADVTSRFDLGAPILAAEVISAMSKVVEFLDQVYEQITEELQWVINGKAISDSQPPQILVASLDSGDLIFLYAKEVAPGDVRFVHAKRRLLGGISQPERYGRHLAMDPESRSMALASSMTHLAVFSLKHVDKIKDEIDIWESAMKGPFQPFKEETFLQVDGFIICMDFLPSTPQDPHKITLLLLVAGGGHTSILLYRWDNRRSLQHIKPLRCSGQRLAENDAHPLMLIPSSKFSTFIIVTEIGLSVYDNILSTEARRIEISLPKETPEDWDGSSSPPLWVQWAKAKRHAAHRLNHDDFFLAREDGLLRYYILNYKSSSVLDANFSPGHLGINIDSAFCILPGPTDSGGDTFIVGGDMTDGGVFHCLPRELPRLAQLIPNTAPINDMLTVEISDNAEDSPRQPRAERMFTCSGKGSGHCHINELRFGTSAQLGWGIPNPDARSITRMWTLEDSTNDRLLLIASHPLHTSVMAIPFPTADNSIEVADSESCPGIDFDCETLAMASIMRERFIQITSEGIISTSFLAEFKPIHVSHGLGRILAADIDISNSLIAITVQTTAGFELRIGRIMQDDGSFDVEFAKTSYTVKDQPIALKLSTLVNANILAVSTNADRIHIFLFDISRGFKLLVESNLAKSMNPNGPACANSLQILSQRNSTCAILLCGLRNGTLSSFTLRLEEGSQPTLRMQFNESFNLGSATVYLSGITSDTSGTTGALAYCGSELRRITLVSDTTNLDYQVTSVWLSDVENPSRPQPMVNAASMVPNLVSSTDTSLSGSLIWASEEELLVSSLGLLEEAVSRRIKVEGTPLRLAYSRTSQKLIVAGMHTVTVPDRKNAAPTRTRISKPYLQVIPSRGPHTTSENSENRNLMVFGTNGERVRCLLYWRPSDGQKHYELVIVGLDADAADIHRRSGRVLAIRLKSIGPDPQALDKIKVVAKYPGKPVYSLCAFGQCSLLIAAGNNLMMQALDVDSRKWSLLNTFVLPSCAFSLSTKGSYIFAATSLHSVLILKEQNGTLNYHSSDARARNATNVLTSRNSPTLVTTSSQAGSIVIGLSEQPQSGRANILFEAVMPFTIDRIRRINEPSKQRARQCFHGSTYDGTIVRLMTLTNSEWQLLRFLENLSPLRSNKSENSSDSGMSLDDEPWEAVSAGSASGDEAQYVTAMQMHIHGDALAGLIRSGPCSLLNLITPKVKMEDDIDFESRQKARYAEFQRLATPVIGLVEDPVGEMTRWLRSLLRMPQ